MLSTVVDVGILWLSGVLAAAAVLAVRARSGLARVLAVDTLVLVLVALLVLVAYARESVRYLDSALVLALLGFIGTLSAVRYLSEGRVL